MAFRLSARARRDLGTILEYSLKIYGRAAAGRYQHLLQIAMEDVGNAPSLAGSRSITTQVGVRTYSISYSRLKTPPAQRVANPAHQLVYRLADDGIVEILAVIRESYPAGRVPLR